MSSTRRPPRDFLFLTLAALFFGTPIALLRSSPELVGPAWRAQLDQVYHGVEREHALAEQAAVSTRGQVLSAKRHLVEAYFHAACGGQTESAAEGWGNALDYLPGSPCGRCMTSGTNRANWTVKVSRRDVDKAFAGLAGGSVDGVKIRARTASKRVKSVELSSGKKKKVITGADFRRLLGWSVVWSTQIDKITLKGDTLTVVGRGSGHGVGMCQWGARLNE